MRLVKHFLNLVIWIFLISVLICGCGGNGSSIELPPLPDFVPGSVSDAERTAALTEVNAFFETVKADPGRANAILTKLQSMPIFVFVEIAKSKDVAAWFKDGRCLIVATSLDRTYRPALNPISSKPTEPEEKGLSHGKKAVLINAFEPARDDATAEIAPNLIDKGYETTLLSGTVEDFKTLQGVGLLFVHAHGMVSTDKFRKSLFWYGTSTRVSATGDAAYRQALDDGTMIYTSAEVLEFDGTSTTQTSYTVSTQFLKNAGQSFTPNATWISQSCTSYGAEILKYAVNELQIGAYMGWTQPQLTSDSTVTTRLLFDRLLGLNVYLPGTVKRPPMTFYEVNNLMRDNIRPGTSITYSSSVSDGVESNFDYTVNSKDTRTIVPSIVNTSVDVAANSLTIEGYFGPASGAGPITLNGSILTVKSWTEDKVTVELPAEPSGKLLLRSIGAPSNSGYLFSNSFDYLAIGVKLSPAAANLAHNELQTFTADIQTGTAPAGAKYRWTVVGDGSVNGSSTVTTTAPTASYRSGNTDGTDTLNLELLDSSNTVVAKAAAVITVGTSSRISFVISGNWDSKKTPPNGSYSYAPGEGTRFSPEEGLEALAFGYNIGAKEQTIGVLVSIIVTPGQPVTAPSTYTVGATGQPPVPGNFFITLSTNQTDPDDPDSTQHKAGEFGTLTINSITNLPDNKKRVSYTFETSNGAGGTVTGSGVQIYTGI